MASPSKRLQKKIAARASAGGAISTNAFGADRADWARALRGGDGSLVAQALAMLAPNPILDGPLCGGPIVHGPEQLAAEQVGHLLDGWRFLSSAFYACVTNSPANVVHFSYYAELRAAFSLMAATGLRLRWLDSYFIDVAGSVHKLGNWPTHACVWKVWPEWVKRNDVVGRFLGAFKLHPAVPLDQMLAVLNSQFGASTLGAWGLDLLKPLSDHDHRNDASYQPTIVASPQGSTSAKTVNVFRKAWELMLPGGSALRFDECLSAYLLFKTISSRTGLPTVPEVLAAADFSQAAEVLSRHFGLPTDVFADAISNNAHTFELFDFAADDGADPENVLVRALFMLRVASAFVSAEVPSGSDVRQRLTGWLDRIGLFTVGAGVAVADTYQDYEDALDRLPSSFNESNICGLEVNSDGVRLTRADAVVAWAI